MIDRQDVLAAIARQTDAIRETTRFVHEHPELGHEEHECSRYLCDTLAAAGLEVEPNVGGMETAFRASLRPRGAGGRPRSRATSRSRRRCASLRPGCRARADAPTRCR